ncbi:MAG TPA: 16S rRNA (cytosine(1402)-N(4))-methyltransferase [Actinobacteria bacterium]|nr:16S rRNA (cytosine(1402)-N(4))-methyltransferase [Actinomycetota bacterium]
MDSAGGGPAHRPVLALEVVELLAGKALVIDATLGAGGHAEALLEGGVGTVLGIDRDPYALTMAGERLARFGARFRPLRSTFSRLAEAAASAGVEEADGVLFDLGVSSMQLDQAARGFTYRGDGPLDMRMASGADDDGPTAADVVNGYAQEELARVIFTYGEERHSRRIAAAIVRARNRAPLSSTGELAAIVAGAVPKRRGGGHPARRTFQALRIEVNQELEELAACLPQAASLLTSGGRLVVIAYHSLEDRIVKRFLLASNDLTSLTKKPVRPSERESASNPRSRSARLRAAEKVVA